MTTEAERLRLADYMEIVATELEAQKDTWGIQDHPVDFWLGIVMEEVGEVAKSVIERDGMAVWQEGCQAIACIVQLMQKAEQLPSGGGQSWQS